MSKSGVKINLTNNTTTINTASQVAEYRQVYSIEKGAVTVSVTLASSCRCKQGLQDDTDGVYIDTVWADVTCDAVYGNHKHIHMPCSVSRMGSHNIVCRMEVLPNVLNDIRPSKLVKILNDLRVVMNEAQLMVHSHYGNDYRLDNGR